MKRLLIALLLIPSLVFGQVTTSPSVTGIPAPQSNVAITGGTITGLSSPLPVASGGTGVTTSTGSGNVVLSTSPTITTPAIVGQTSASTVAAGRLGEQISSSISSGSAVALTTNTPANITNITLTAGYWIVFGNVSFSPAGTTATSYIAGSSSTTSATLVTGNGFLLPGIGAGLVGTLASPITVTIMNVSGSTQIFLVAQSQFSVSTMAAYGSITAIRIN